MEKNKKDLSQKSAALTEQKKETQFEALFNYATISIIVTDGKGVIINFNKQAEIEFEYSKEEVLGNTVEILLPQAIHSKHEALRQSFHQHPANRPMGAGRDLYAKKKNGAGFPVEVSLCHCIVENEVRVIAFVIDISVRKSNEYQLLQKQKQLEQSTDEVKKLNAELEQRVQERTMMLKETLAELVKSREELKEALTKEKELGDLKSRFVSMASHEFRTPLSTVLTSLSLIGKYTITEEQDKRDRHILRGKEAVNNMRNILEDFLSLGKLEEGKIEAKLSEFNLKEFLEHIIDETQNLLKPGQQFIYQHEGQLNILSDPSLLTNIIINLISNAVKFSPENSTITISSYVDDNKIQISVKDEGIGISKEDVQHLFERFFRAGNAQNIQGTGLGLNIISKYLELMDGKINCTSELERGSEFTITFDKQ